MFQFQEKQLYWMILLILVTGGTFFFLFGIKELPDFKDGQFVAQMDDFSEGWLYRGQKDVEVVFFPATVDTAGKDKLSFYHRTPDMTNENLYLVFETKRQPVQIKIDDMLIYESSKWDKELSAHHTIKITPDYQNKNIIITYDCDNEKKIQAPALKIGTKNQLLGQLIHDNFKGFLWGIILFLICFCMVLPYAFIKNTRFAKSTLLYGCLEGMTLGVLGILQGSVLPVMTGWNYGIYMLRISLLVVLGILHLMVMRCFTYKKKILSQIGFGIVFYLVYFISVMVLQFFDLLALGTIETATKIVFAIAIMVYLCIYGKYYLQEAKKTTKLVLYANGILALSIVFQMIMNVVGRELSVNDVILPVGFTIYQLLLLYLGWKRACHIEQKRENVPYREEEVRARVVEQINPNLLFASFHTLQNLIKNGSSNSVKMIYYISVYFRDNLKAMENQGETIPFSQELEHILAYLQLQKTRNENLQYKVECKVSDFQIPRHSLEPLIENAVKHGIAGKGNKGNVILRTYMRADGYAIQIIDDGIGFDKKILKNNSNTSVPHLISLLEYSCNAQTELISQEGKGTVITIVLPMLENDLMEDDQQENDQQENVIP